MSIVNMYAAGTATADANGPGYDRARPLSSVSAIFALKRKLGE